MNLKSLSDVLSTETRDLFTSLLESKDKLMQAGAYDRLSKWYEIGQIAKLHNLKPIEAIEKYDIKNVLDLAKEKGTEDQFLSQISQSIGKNIMNSTLDSIVAMLSDRISHKTMEVGFNMHFSLPPFRPYVELVQRINDIPYSRIKIDFEVDTEVDINDVVVNRGDKLRFSRGNLSLGIAIYLRNALGPFFKNRTLLGKRDFEINLDGLEIDPKLFRQ